MSKKINRRTFLGGLVAGATAGAVGGVSSFSNEALAKEAVVFDQEVDVVVVGSGAGGCAAAVTARDRGLSVIVVEKAASFGGTTFKSQGGYWIPANSQMSKFGVVDKKKDALRYMARLSFPQMYRRNKKFFGLFEQNYFLHETFYDNAGKTIDYLENLGALKSMMHLDFPDYYADLPENKTPYGRLMTPMTDSGERGAGADLISQMDAWLRKNNVQIQLQTKAEQLILDGRKVVGLKVSNHKGESKVIGARRGVIFATGGYTHQQNFTTNFLKGPIFGGCDVPTNQGDFIPIASSLGASLGNMSNAWWGELVVEEAIKSRSVVSDIWQPYGASMILVNKYGKRVVDEKLPYHERTQVHFVWDPKRGEYSNLLLFMIFDEKVLQSTNDNPILRFPVPSLKEKAEFLIKGQSWEELQEKISDRLFSLRNSIGEIDLEPDFKKNFEGTIKNFNRYARTGRDLEFGRGETKIERYFNDVSGYSKKYKTTMTPFSRTGPYYAIILGPGVLSTNGGPTINEKAEVLSVTGEVIQGLYGAGNCVASPAGSAYWGPGTTLGLALTFGSIAGRNV